MQTDTLCDLDMFESFLGFIQSFSIGSELKGILGGGGSSFNSKVSLPPVLCLIPATPRPSTTGHPGKSHREALFCICCVVMLVGCPVWVRCHYCRCFLRDYMTTIIMALINDVSSVRIAVHVVS